MSRAGANGTAVGSAVSARQRITDIAAASPDEPALAGLDSRNEPETLTWRMLDDAVAKAVAILAASGSEPESAPVICVPATNTVQVALDVVVAMCAGIPIFPVDPRLRPAEIRALTVAVAAQYRNSVWLPVSFEGTDSERLVRAVIDHGAARGGENSAGVAYLLGTGGSTGVPTPVPYQGPVRYDPLRIPNPLVRQANWRSGQRQLIIGPLYHAAPFTYFMEGVLDANSIVLQPTFVPDLTLRLIREHRIEWLQLTPSHLQALLAGSGGGGTDLTACFASVRGVLHTAAPCPRSLKEQWLRVLGPNRLFEMYSAAEGIGSTFVDGQEWLARPGTVGRGFLTQIRVLDDDGRRVPPDVVGTVYMRKPLAPRRRPRPGMPPTPDGFQSVGDRGYLDRDGYLYLVGRADDMVTVGGENVQLAEVEGALREHPEVVDALVVAMPDHYLGHRLTASVVLAPDGAADRSDLLAFCASRLAPYKVPDAIDMVAAVPRTAGGKLQRWRATR